MADFLWEFRRDDGSGWTDQVRLDVDDLGQLVLSVWNDHDEWDEVVLPPDEAAKLTRALADWSTARANRQPRRGAYGVPIPEGLCGAYGADEGGEHMCRYALGHLGVHDFQNVTASP